MSAHEPRALVQAFVAAINARDLDAFDETLAAEYRQHAVGAQPGLAGVKALFKSQFARMPDLHATVSDLLSDGEFVFARTTVSGTMSGTAVQSDIFDLWRIRDGKLAEHWGPATSHEPPEVEQQPTGNVEQTVVAAEAEWVEVYLRNDADTFANLITDDFLYTSPAGEVVDHDTYITNLRDDVVHMDYIHSEDLKVRRYGEQTAIVTATWKVKERYKDDQAEGAFRITRVWIRQPDRWRAATFQVTLVDSRLSDT